MQRTHLALAFLCFLLLSCNPPVEPKASDFDLESEKAAIMKTIDDETKCFFQRNYDCWKSYYIQSDYAFQAWSNPDGTFDASVGWTAIDTTAGNWIKNNPVPPGGSSHPKVERRNQLFHFYSDSLVYMSWDQYNSNPEQTTYAHSKETRLMEKHDGIWKIANVTAFWDYKNLIPIDSLK